MKVRRDNKKVRKYGKIEAEKLVSFKSDKIVTIKAENSQWDMEKLREAGCVMTVEEYLLLTNNRDIYNIMYSMTRLSIENVVIIDAEKEEEFKRKG